MTSYSLIWTMTALFIIDRTSVLSTNLIISLPVWSFHYQFNHFFTGLIISLPRYEHISVNSKQSLLNGEKNTRAGYH